MIKRLITVAVMVVGANIAAYSQEVKADSVSFDKPNEFRIYRSNSPVKAFVVVGDVVWYATDEIVTSLNIRTNAQQRFPRLGTIASEGVKAMAVDGSGQIWIASPGGVAVRSGNNFTAYTAENGLPDNNALSLAVSKGDVWVGTANGAARFRNGSWTTFTTEQGLVSNKVQAVVVDSKGTVWFGTDRGINSFDGSKWQLYDARQRHLEWNDVKALAVEPGTDVIWAATGPKDIARFDGKEWRKYMEIHPGVTSIMNDTRRTWFGSPTGLFRLNTDGEWVFDPNRLGIPASQVYQMFRDGRGDLWFAMEQGVLWLNNPYRR
jgi:ligand-binding sensor domain-containing protein